MKGWYRYGMEDQKRTRRLRRYAEDCTIDKKQCLIQSA